ncbi:MAG: hypothetical protein JJ992_21560 [Planctomycetes bacterium]|nr:hypothetical protein [Planctomycetota bacterium]
MRLAMVDKTGELAEEEQAGVRQRLLFLLARFANRIRSVRLVCTMEEQFSVNSFVCRGTVTMRDGRQSKAEDRSADVMTTATRVADRLGRAVARQVECKHGSGPRSTRGI